MDIIFFNSIMLIFFMCQIHYMLAFQLFTLFYTFPFQYLLGNTFDKSKNFNVIKLRRVYLFISKVCEQKFIKILNKDEFQFWIKVRGLKTFKVFCILNHMLIFSKIHLNKFIKRRKLIFCLLNSFVYKV